MNYDYQNTSIYSCSWGPPDNGRAMEGPNYLIRKAMVNGIQKGRAGKGSIFVFASGNGGRTDDQCNFDGYTNSIFSVTVAAVDHMGLHPDYSEACAANMVVAYSSGSGNAIVRVTHSHRTLDTQPLADHYGQRYQCLCTYSRRYFGRSTERCRCLCTVIASEVSRSVFSLILSHDLTFG